MIHFLALRPAAETRARLAAVAERLQAWDLPARWIQPDDYHLTVAYLGEMDTTEASGLVWAVEDVARSLRSPELALPGLGALGGRTEPRVVYAAITDPDDYCRDLHADLHDALGERADASFLPHITVCRPRTQRSVMGHTWRELLEAHGLATWGGCTMTHLSLMVTDPQGSLRYRELERWTLPCERRAAG